MAKKEYNKDDFTVQVNKQLGRLFHNKGVLNDEDKKAQIDASVDFYVRKMGEVSSPTQISSIIYSEYAISHYRGSVTKGLSALWNAVHAAYKGFGAFPVAVVAGAVALVFVLVAFALIAAAFLAVVLIAAGGLFYIYVGFIGFTFHAATALAFAGIGLLAVGACLLFANFAKRFIVKSIRLVSVPIFALCVCVRQYARSKRVMYTQ